MKNRNYTAMTLAAASLGTCQASADLIWTNGEAESQVTLPHQDGAMVDDFVVPEGGAWLHAYRTCGYFSGHGEETGACFVAIRSNTGENTPGSVLLELNLESTSDVMNGEIVDGRAVHDIDLRIEATFLPGGRYWIDLRVESQQGSGLIQLGSAEATAEPAWFRNAAGEMLMIGGNVDTSFELSGDVDEVVQIAPSSFDITYGNHLSGTPLELRESDDRHIVIDSMYAFSAPLIQIEVTGTSQGDHSAIEVLSLVIESETLGTLRDGLLRVEAYDFDQNRWVYVSMQSAPADEGMIVLLLSNPRRFFDPELGDVKTRLSWMTSTLRGLPAWGVKIDQAAWYGLRQPH